MLEVLSSHKNMDNLQKIWAMASQEKKKQEGECKFGSKFIKGKQFKNYLQTIHANIIVDFFWRTRENEFDDIK